MKTEKLLNQIQKLEKRLKYLNTDSKEYKLITYEIEKLKLKIRRNECIDELNNTEPRNKDMYSSDGFILGYNPPLPRKGSSEKYRRNLFNLKSPIICVYAKPNTKNKK